MAAGAHPDLSGGVDPGHTYLVLEGFPPLLYSPTGLSLNEGPEDSLKPGLSGTRLRGTGMPSRGCFTSSLVGPYNKRVSPCVMESDKISLDLR